MPFRKIFRSRWAALLWAGGILWTAVDTIGFGPPASTHAATPVSNASATDTDATGVPVDTADLAILANAMNGQ